MKPIRIGLIGVNEHSHSVQMHTRFHQYKDYFEVVGIAFPENEKERLPGKIEKLHESWEKAGLAQPMTEDTTGAIKVGVEAMKRIIAADKK